MARFTTDYVNLIANNLRDRYKTGFPVLKELVQNADDAGATSLAFGYHPGFAGAVDHELLAGPALWVLNNGRFTAGDRLAIQSFGINGKAAESGAIGKFGLGMKSVFHLCEAFFYVASDGQQLFGEVLSPWFQDNGMHDMHALWETVSDRDRQAMNSVAAEHHTWPDDKSWFMLWVPLRQKVHVPLPTEGYPTAPIIDRYPGDANGKDLDFFTENDIERRIGNLLPLLRHLQRIHFVGTDAVAPFDLQVELCEDSPRLDHITHGLRAQGSVIDSGPKTSRLHFVAMQTVLREAESFAKIQASSGWPKSMAITSGGRTSVPDKGQPEGAVVVSHADKRKSQLTLQWAVFLPTEEGRYRYQADIPNGSREYSLTLHGQFFVDAGRRGIDGMDRLGEPIVNASKQFAESAVQLAWNQTLAQELVLPSVLPALAEYVEAEKLMDVQATELTDALVRSAAVADSGVPVRFVATFVNHLCRKHAWVRTLRPNGAQWELVPSDTLMLPLPRPAAGDHGRPWRSLPALQDLARVKFIDSQAPAIYRSTTSWDEERVATALARMPAETLTREVELKYLIDFLSMHKDRALNTLRIQQQLVRLIREVLRRVRLSEVRAHRQHFKHLMELLPARLCFGLGTRTTDAKSAIPEKIYQQLIKVESDALLVPADLAPDGDDLGHPAVNDVEAWLVQVDRLIDDDFDVGSCLGVAEHFLKAIKGTDTKAAQPDLLRRFPRLRILRAVDVRTGNEIATSLEALRDSHGKHLVFRAMDPKKRLGFTTYLAAVAPELELCVLGADTFRIFQQAMLPGAPNLPRTDDASAMFECLGVQAIAPKLGIVDSRTSLLDHVGSADLTKPAVRDGVRYLLHGEPDHFKSSGVLWKNPSSQDSPWVRLWRMISDDTWNVLPGELSGQIPDKCSQQLNIKAVEQATVTAKLRVVPSFDAVDAQRFSETELDQILGQVEDETAWRKLPLHRDAHGTFGPVSGHCYLGNHPELPSGTGANLRFIVKSGDEMHRRRQEQFITKWSPAQAAVTVLRSSDAVGHWRYLMDRLQDMSFSDIAATGAWKDVAWLPLVPGGSISPSSLIQLDGLEAEVSTLAAQCEFAYAGISELAPEVQAHPAFDKLKPLLPSGPEALRVFAELMVDADLTIGAVVASISEDFFRHHNALLCSLSSLPAWPLIAKAAQITSYGDIAVHVLGAVASPLTLQHAEKVLLELTQKVLAPDAREVYFVYLREWVKTDTAAKLRSRLTQMKLLSAGGEWRSAAELVHGALGIDPANCVHPKVGEILRGTIATNNNMPLEPIADGEQARDNAYDGDLESAIERWCEPFSQSSVQPAIGALIGLFGAGVKPMAERWLSPIAYADYLAKLNWKDPGYESGYDRRRRWMGGNPSIERPLTLLQPVFVESLASTVQVKSLTGEKLEVSLASTSAMSTLLAGPLNWLGGYGVEVRMRPLECLRNFDLAQQKSILQRTAEDLLHHFYGQDQVNLSGLWVLFDEADQVELDIARSLILDGLPQLLLQLPKVKKHPLLANAFAMVDKGRRDIASAKNAGSDLQPALFYGALDNLADLVSSNDSVQQAVLDGIRKKIVGYQYERSSIPFEILQNADDAVVEYQEMQCADGRSPFPEAEIGRFVIAGTEQGLMLMHWGRPINYTGRHQNRRDEYAKDLERMLMLGASAKDAEDGVTGKFGLGFKSVLLATDRPVVASGDLHFEIVAGCLPQRAELSPSAKQRAAQYKRESLRSTVVELPITPDCDQDELVQRFTSLAGLCAVFTRQIRHIEVNGTLHSWVPECLLKAETARCELGQVLVPYKRGLVPSRLLVVRSKLGAMVIRLDGHVVAFDHGADHAAPAIWVTEPTRGTAAAGVILNADFKIDTGRSGLAQGGAVKRNLETARQLADSLAPAFAEFFNQTRADWATWSARIAAVQQSSAVKYWHTVWTVMFGKALSEDASQDAQLTAVFVQRLFGRVLERSGVVPNGLPGQLAAFVRRDALRLAVPCHRLQGVLPVLSAWPTFSSLYPSSTWCSDDVASWVREHKAADDSLKELDRAALFNALGAQKKLDPAADLPHLAAVINAWPKGPTEDQGWRNELANVQLRSRTGAWKPASSLHFSTPGQDDLLALFAPDDCLLDNAYQVESAAWRTVCQYLTSKEFSASNLARWCLNAATDESRRAVLCWLSQHLDARPVWQSIKTLASDNHWILGLHLGHPLLSGLDDSEQHPVLACLGVSMRDHADDMEMYSISATALDLAAVHGWWLEHRQKYLPKYERALWPQRVDRSKLADDSIDRETWMTLFSLGVFRRFGRVRDEQNRGFLDFLHSRGWWATISEVHPDNGAEQWIGILREYAETNQVTGDFEQWMDSFPRLYRLARWCNDYAELFRGLQFRDKNDAKRLLTPATDASLSGSGFDAPTIHRTLRIGHNLVIRELLRTGVLNSEVAQSMAFMPGRAVKDFLEQMGHTDLETSQDIHELLINELGSVEQASFGGDYDIPLILLAGNDNLQREVAEWAEQQAQADYESALFEEDAT